MLRVKEVAERLALSESKIYQLVRSGELPHYKIGGAVRVSEEQLLDFLTASKRERVEVKASSPPSTRSPLRHIRLS